MYPKKRAAKKKIKNAQPKKNLKTSSKKKNYKCNAKKKNKKIKIKKNIIKNWMVFEVLCDGPLLKIK